MLQLTSNLLALSQTMAALNITAYASEKNHENVSISMNTSVTTARMFASKPSPSIPWSFLVKYSVLFAMMPMNLAGNGLTLAAFLTNAHLQTKTNRILASLTCTDMLTMILLPPVFVYYVNGYLYRNPCDYGYLYNFMQAFGKLLPKISDNHLVVVAMDRYVAIVHPLSYESYLTDKVCLLQRVVNIGSTASYLLFHDYELAVQCHRQHRN